MATNDNVPFVVNLEDKHAIELDIVGGKGANLAILFERGFSVPDAFIVTTNAFQYVLNNDQTKVALSTIDTINVDNIQDLENLSNNIKTTICNINLPNNMIDLIIKYYNK